MRNALRACALAVVAFIATAPAFAAQDLVCVKCTSDACRDIAVQRLCLAECGASAVSSCAIIKANNMAPKSLKAPACEAGCTKAKCAADASIAALCRQGCGFLKDVAKNCPAPPKK